MTVEEQSVFDRLFELSPDRGLVSVKEIPEQNGLKCVDCGRPARFEVVDSHASMHACAWHYCGVCEVG